MVIRCPTPPSAQWTFQPPQGADKVSFQERGRWRNPSRRPADVSYRARVSPDEAHEIACAREKQLQNAINALDEKDPFVASTRSELQKARSKARLVPVEDRVKSTAFLARLRVSTVTGTSTNAELERLLGLVAELTQGNSERMLSRTSMRSWRLSAKSDTRCRRHCRRSRPTTMPKGSMPAHWPLLQSTLSL